MNGHPTFRHVATLSEYRLTSHAGVAAYDNGGNAPGQTPGHREQRHRAPCRLSIFVGYDNESAGIHAPVELNANGMIELSAVGALISGQDMRSDGNKVSATAALSLMVHKCRNGSICYGRTGVPELAVNRVYFVEPHPSVVDIRQNRWPIITFNLIRRLRSKAWSFSGRFAGS